MGGVIRPDVRGSLCECGGKFERIEDAEYQHPVPRCVQCRKAPAKLLVRISLPVVGKVDIRHNSKGTRIKTLAQADAFLIDVHDEIKSRTFKPELYMSNRAQDHFAVEKFVKAYIDRKRRNVGKKAGCSPNFVRQAQSLAKNYIYPYFGKMDIREVRHSHLVGFLENADSTNQAARALEMLRPIMREVAKDFDSMKVPEFPSIPKPKQITREKFLDRDTQLQVLDNVNLYRDPISLMVIYPMRPCEVRALQWQDIDLKANTLTIQRHYSRRTLLPGRKSNFEPGSPEHRVILRLVPEARAIFEGLVRPLDPNEFIFKTRNGKPIYEDAMRKAWNKACDKVGVKHVWFYADTKHVTMDHYHNDAGIPLEDLKALSGHTNINMVQRYSPTKSLAVVDRHIDKLGGAKGVQQNSNPKNSKSS